jgi:hypothetical protein
VTLLTIIGDASVECGVEEPNVVIGNTDIVVRKMLRAANRVGLDLVKRRPWGALRRVGSFTAVAGQDQSGFAPADFDRLIAETLWDRTNRRLIAGSADAARWQSLAATMQGVLAGHFTLRGTSLSLYPPAVGGESMAFEYVSRNFAQTAGGVNVARWTNDTDIGLLSEEMFTLGVVAFWLKGEGLPWEAAMGDYESRVLREMQTDDPSVSVLTAGDIFAGSRHWTGEPGSRQGGWGGDLFDLDDSLLS